MKPNDIWLCFILIFHPSNGTASLFERKNLLRHLWVENMKINFVVDGNNTKWHGGSFTVANVVFWYRLWHPTSFRSIFNDFEPLNWLNELNLYWLYFQFIFFLSIFFGNYFQPAADSNMSKANNRPNQTSNVQRPIIPCLNDKLPLLQDQQPNHNFNANHLMHPQNQHQVIWLYWFSQKQKQKIVFS